MLRLTLKIVVCGIVCLLTFASPAVADFGLHAGSHLGFGHLGGDGQNVGNRDMGTLDLQALPGYRLDGMGLLLGPLINFRMLSQLAGDKTEEFSGSGLTLGIGAVYEIKPLKFLLSYDLKASHSHSEPDTTYKGSGFTLLFGYLMLPEMFLDFEINKSAYDKKEVANAGSPAMPLSINHWNFAVGVSLSI
jgi:hypothetical protein